MRKMFVFVVLAGLAATGCATGGGGYIGAKPYPGPLGEVVAGNLGLTCPGDVFVGAPVNRCLRDIGGSASRYASSPMYRGGVGGPQLSQVDKLAIFCGLGGSGVAMVMNAGLKRIVGAGLISAASCEVAGAIMARKGSNNNQQQRDNGTIVVPPSPGQGVRIASDGTPVAVGTRPGYQPQPEPEWQMLRNEFKGVTIYARIQGSDPNQPIIIPAGQTVTVQIPRGSQIWAEAQVCVNEGCTVQRWRQDVGRWPLPQGAGWVFYNPEEGR